MRYKIVTSTKSKNLQRYLLVESGALNTPSSTPDSIDFDYQKESNDLLYIIKYYKHAKKNQDLFQKKMKQYKITNGENLEKLMLSSFFGGESALMGIPIGASIYAAIKAANKLINGIGNPAANLGIAIVGSVLVYVFWKVFMFLFKRSIKNHYEHIMTSEQQQLDIETQLLFNRIQILAESQYFAESDARQQANNMINKVADSSDSMVNQIEQAPQSFFQKYKKIIFFILLCIGCALAFWGIRSGINAYQQAHDAKLDLYMKQSELEDQKEIAKINKLYAQGHEKRMIDIAKKQESLRHSIKSMQNNLNKTNDPQAREDLTDRINALIKVDNYYTRELQTQAPTYEELWRHQK